MSRFLVPVVAVGATTFLLNFPVLATSNPSPNQPVSLYVSRPQARTGQSVTLYAASTQKLAPNQTLSIINKATGQVVASTSSGSSLYANFITSAPLTYQFGATVTTNSRPVNVTWVDRGIGTVEGYQNALGQTVHLTVPTTSNPGVPITLTATPQKFSDATYQFWWAANGGRWHGSGSYSPSNQFTFMPPVQGVYAVTVYAREKSAPSPETSVQRAQYEAKANTHQVIVGTPPSSPAPVAPVHRWVSLSTSNAYRVGDTITITATGHGFTNPQYQFWFELPNGKWQSSGYYASQNKFSMSATVPGVWHVVAFARSGTSTGESTYSPTLDIGSLPEAIAVH